ncbi:MAG: TIGR00282 family metallophosphoesterase [Patescibacteria group bacterium]
MPASRPLTFLIFGDVFGRPGRAALAQVIPALRKKYDPDLVIANAENIAHGVGVTEKTLAECQAAGVDFFTSGNHVFKKKEVIDLLTKPEPVLLRPANYPPGTPGVGSRLLTVGTKHILVINLNGRVFFTENFDDPFRTLDAILKEYESKKPHAIIVDIHSEATSEAVSLGWYADGRASLVFGTHTHIPTADARILPRGTAYITDVGMIGLKDSVLGEDKDEIIKSFLTQQPFTHTIPENGLVSINGIVVKVDPKTSHALSIESIHQEVDV